MHNAGLAIHRCDTLEEAVETAAKNAQLGDVVLLAPGGTSFDAFRDFVERGERFRELVEAL
jgi:UDP-N-acetylmuramoylalanine--D-glutamate ligase